MRIAAVVFSLALPFTWHANSASTAPGRERAQPTQLPAATDRRDYRIAQNGPKEGDKETIPDGKGKKATDDKKKSAR